MNLSSPSLSFMMETSSDLVEFLQLLIQTNRTKVGSLFSGCILSTGGLVSKLWWQYCVKVNGEFVYEASL